VLQEIHEEQDILLAGVFDGHGGCAASHAAAEMVPYLMSETLRRKDESSNVQLALESAWETTCDTYRHGCINGECSADYDPVEGTLKANTGSADLVAGTTASLVAVQDGKMTVLNVGDSRSLFVDGSNGKLFFRTEDHTPEAELERLKSDPAYSNPKCSLSRWYLSVGDYQYAVARSLEGPFATSKGIVSFPDMSTITTASNGILVVATDGLFEVMDNEEVGRDVAQFRREGDSAGVAAKKLCTIAIEKGTSDNVSVVVVYLGS
jgi:serine/threonine protein phosphatase PrpC